MLASSGNLSSITLSYSYSSATLTCKTTGGPASIVTWSKDSVQIPSSSSTYQQSQRVKNTTTSTYLNLLIINSTNVSDYSGSFSVNVSNDRASSVELESTISCEFNHIFNMCLLIILHQQLFESLEIDHSH